jgi:hypothetical protein
MKLGNILNSIFKENKMKKLLILACLLLLPISATAADYDNWCYWDGSKGDYCRAERNGAIKVFTGIRVGGDDANKNSHGYFKLDTITPAYDPATQKLGAEVWGKVGDTITQTWTVESMTVNEQNERVGEASSI